MTEIPAWYWAGVYTSLCLALIGAALLVVRWQQLDSFRRDAAMWMVASGVFSCIAIASAKLWQNSQVSTNIWHLVSITVASLTASAASTGKRGKATYAYLAATYLCVWGLAMVTVQNLGSYGTFTSPLHALTLLGLGAAILFRRVGFAKCALLDDPGS